MRIAVPREATAGERRVALVPESVRRLVGLGLEVAVEAGAGAGAFFDDAAYESAGATVVPDPADLLASADVVAKVAPPTPEEITHLQAGTVLVCVLDPAAHTDVVRDLGLAEVTSFALDAMPRITRAQSMDVRSSQSTVAGYRAVLLAAETMGKMAPMMMTAAGTIRPARALVIGAGVAGLQAVATARRLGAVVAAVDTRPAVAEQVESLGARFVSLEVSHEEAEAGGGYAADLGEEFYVQEQTILAPHVAQADMIIATALVPGRAAPKLITEPMVAAMKGGSVIVDLAAAAGGNCTLTRPDKRVEGHGVTILGPTNLPAGAPVHASEMFSRNVEAFLGELIRDGRVELDTHNEIIRETLITSAGEVVLREVAGDPADGEDLP